MCVLLTGEGQYGKVYTCISVDTGELMAMKEVSGLALQGQTAGRETGINEVRSAQLLQRFFFSFFANTEFFSLIYKREKEGERTIDLLFQLFMHSLIESCMCPDWGLNLLLWCVGTML